MKLHSSIGLIVLLLLSPVTANAQKSTKSILTKAAQYVTRAEAAMKKATGILDKSADSNNGQPLDSAIQSAKNQAEQVKELLDKGEELLKSVPDSEADKSPVQKDFDAATTAYKDLLKRLEGATETIAQNDAKNAAGAANDQDTLDALADTLLKVSSDSRANKPDIARVDLYPQVKKDIEAMVAKYGQSKGSRGANRDFTATVIGLKNQFTAFETTIKTTYPKSKVEVIKAMIVNLRKELEIGKASDTFTAFLITIPSQIDSLQKNCHVYSAFVRDHPEYKPAIIDEANALIKLCQDETAKKERELIANNKVPASGYSGADKDTLIDFVRKNFLAKHPQAKIKRIVLEDNAWARITQWKWSSSLAWYKEDYSTMDAYVITAGENPEHVYNWGTPLLKDHMSGSQLRVVLPNSIAKPRDIFSILLASKLN